MSGTLTKNNRIPSIDRFRGTVIFCMVIFQFIAYFDNLGAIANISSHALMPTQSTFFQITQLQMLSHRCSFLQSV